MRVGQEEREGGGEGREEGKEDKKRRGREEGRRWAHYIMCLVQYHHCTFHIDAMYLSGLQATKGQSFT